MALTPERITEITKSIIKSAFFNYFLCREEVKTKHLVLSRFFPEESVVRSAIGGIETSLGSFWEKVARAIAIENGFQILDPRVDLQEPKRIPTAISHLLDAYKYQREAAHANIPMSAYVLALNNEISRLQPTEIPAEYKRLAKGTGADLFLRKGTNEYAFELKTVQINAGSGPKFNETLMKWVTFRTLHQKHLGLTNSFNAHVVIPYDPHITSDWWTQFGERAYPLDHQDLMLADEFWNLMSGIPDTLKAITKAFDDLVLENFQAIYQASIYKSGVNISVQILEAVCGVTCLTQEHERPQNFGGTIKWQCNHCSTEFSKSLRWFAGSRACPSCGVQLSN
ncbi:TdeIII family type II restriction endonuclease [Polynucleobacter asymbioticus]|uniref:TdeIII family type II restriction endonuclease n=1 Tax=Polynucleobacter asymbioticus TaxID=576611 RepID=UPI0008F890E6|nr:TdeIII family type II restriction endonuclease [Polynucleobacter asymbioticus]